VCSSDLNGSITLQAGSTIQATHIASLTDLDANDIAVTATSGDIVAGAVSAGSANGDVTLIATAGSILDDADNTTRITGDVVTLTGLDIGQLPTGGVEQIDTAA